MKYKFSKLIFFLHSKLHNDMVKMINILMLFMTSMNIHEDNILDNENIENLDLSKKDGFER